MRRKTRRRRSWSSRIPWWVKLIGAHTAAAYIVDVVLTPQSVAQQARAFAASRGKPLLNIGAGTPGSSLRAALIGPTLWGDVNIDIAAPAGVAHGKNAVSRGDAHDLSQWPDKHFGAVIASHVLEHLSDPDRALREWHRVADQVFVIVPKWWAPHTWLHPGHRWYISQDSGKKLPLWGTTTLGGVHDRRHRLQG